LALRLGLGFFGLRGSCGLGLRGGLEFRFVFFLQKFTDALF